MEAQHQPSVSNFHALADASPVGFFRADRDGRLTYVNQRWAEITGTPARVAAGARWLRCFAPADIEKIETRWNEAATRGEALTGDYPLDGSHVPGDRWVSVHVQAERGEGGETIGFVGTLTDISFQKQAELEVVRLGNLYIALSQTNKAIVRIRERGELFDRICRIAVDFGHFSRAQIALAVPGTEMAEVVSEAIGSPENHSSRFARTRLAALVDAAIATGAMQLSRPENATPEEIGACAPCSAGALPFFCRGSVVGALGLLADQADLFDQTRLELLSEMAADISYALDNIKQDEIRAKAEEKLRLDALVFEEGDEAIIVCDAENRIVSVNQAFSAITGYTMEDALGKNPSLMASGKHDGEFYRAMWSILIQDGHWTGEIWNRRKNGEIYPEWLKISVVRTPEGGISHYLGVFSDISARKDAENRIQYLSHYDALTELPNRYLLNDRLDQAIAFSNRSALGFAVMLLDIDRFKQVNKTLGLKYGDALLRGIAERLKESLRETDTVARLGGDEFAIVITGITREQLVGAAAQNILASLARPFLIEKQEFFATASIGISLYPRDGNDAQDLLRNAATAMYRVKEEGRNNFQFYALEMNAKSFERLSLENSLRHALAREEFKLHYQPQVDMLTGRIVGAEALVRWYHPELGMVPPINFIPVAEETGLIVPLGEWVLSQACAQAQSWLDAGLPEIQTAVNLSARQFMQPDFAQVVRRTLERAGLERKFLKLEITESMLMHDPEKVIAILYQLKDLGIHLSVDDFGTGYSSLGYLKRFPISELKIDRMFVRDIIANPEDAAISQAIINMAHSLSMRVVAEGVESEAQFNLLRRFNCDGFQGYYCSPPLTADEFAQLLAYDQPFVQQRREDARTLLIVDDEPNILNSLKRTLRNEGYRILAADTSSEAFELLALNDVQVIMCDQRMASMSGTEFLSRVKGLYPDAVRIVLSGYTELEAVTDAVNRGAIYKFLTKPWEDDYLRENVRDAFRHREASRVPRT